MRTREVAPRNGGAHGASLGAVRAFCTLLGALGMACGADARGAEAASSEPEQSTPALQPGTDGLPEPAPEQHAPADEEEAERTSAVSVLPPSSMPNSLPIPSPPLPDTSPQPTPLPSAELDTNRPVDSSAPVDVIVPPGECRFEYLGEWVRCENAGWPNVLETDAPDLLSCMRECLDRDDCTAVTDYLWLGIPGLGCYLYLSTCDEPAFVVWGEEDAGHEFRRSCASP